MGRGDYSPLWRGLPTLRQKCTQFNHSLRIPRFQSWEKSMYVLCSNAQFLLYRKSGHRRNGDARLFTMLNARIQLRVSTDYYLMLCACYEAGWGQMYKVTNRLLNLAVAAVFFVGYHKYESVEIRWTLIIIAWHMTICTLDFSLLRI